jgi:hypothetical protein
MKKVLNKSGWNCDVLMLKVDKEGIRIREK